MAGAVAWAVTWAVAGAVAGAVAEALALAVARAGAVAAIEMHGDVVCKSWVLKAAVGKGVATTTMGME